MIACSKKGDWKDCYLLYTCEMLDTKLCQVQDWKKFVHVFIIC